MSDGKTNANKARDAGTVSTYEVAEFVRRYEVTPGEAKTIIKRYGPARSKLDAYMAARNL